MESILQGISGIAVFLDDVLLSEKSEAEHLATLDVEQTIRSWFAVAKVQMQVYGARGTVFGSQD